METITAAELLERNGLALADLLEGMAQRMGGWKPAQDRWSPLEVACHLLDEERDDFRARIRRTLEHPEEEWPPIDPEGWVADRGYATRDFGETVREFRRERSESVLWLRSAGIDLAAAHDHPQIGRLRVGDLLGSWVAHDLLHLRQLAHLQYLWVGQATAPYSIRYAGEW